MFLLLRKQYGLETNEKAMYKPSWKATVILNLTLREEESRHRILITRTFSTSLELSQLPSPSDAQYNTTRYVVRQPGTTNMKDREHS